MEIIINEEATASRFSAWTIFLLTPPQSARKNDSLAEDLLYTYKISSKAWCFAFAGDGLVGRIPFALGIRHDQAEGRSRIIPHHGSDSFMRVK